MFFAMMMMITDEIDDDHDDNYDDDGILFPIDVSIFLFSLNSLCLRFSFFPFLLAVCLFVQQKKCAICTHEPGLSAWIVIDAMHLCLYMSRERKSTRARAKDTIWKAMARPKDQNLADTCVKSQRFIKMHWDYS